ncbi:MAG TPA: hypothetical protein VK985_09415 [Rariglobus sp.]|nr:hypothetical protein [Rariglobus sp.]
MSTKTIRYAVTINGEPATLHTIKGLYEKTGILMQGGGGKPFTGTQAQCARIMNRTRKVSERLQRSIVAEFIQARLPELKPLFGPLVFDTQVIEPPKPVTA